MEGSLHTFLILIENYGSRTFLTDRQICSYIVTNCMSINRLLKHKETQWNFKILYNVILMFM